ncbi:hypothetical protein Pla108_17200 [Botrimarina colliarenosi]|uniref:Uncharacterized protein n=1 Tax=Botrimarina colliarenosi TaxID=2528001 RepID=A0A5C6AE28_9BACT|nr:hypothetical protein Pla108_17200 [Botrimarina colliarenosi]
MNGPPGTSVEKTPPWISPELVQETLDVWRPYYGFSLTERDAIEILLAVR